MGVFSTTVLVSNLEGGNVGATTLQILMFTVDSANERLIPTNRGRLGYGGNL